MTELQIPSQYVHPGELAAFPANSNTHSPQNIEELAESRRKFSQYKNVVIWTPKEEMTVTLSDGNEARLKPGIKYVIAGEGFWQASKKRRDQDIEIKDFSHLSYEEALLLGEADNASPLGSIINPAQLRANLEQARAEFKDNPRLEAMLDRAREQAGAVEEEKKEHPDIPPQTDRADELQEKWQVNPGDLWTIGPHRLLCGDCREAGDVERVVGKDKVNGIMTSPPYAMQRKQQYGGVEPDEYVDWWEAVQENMRAVLAEDGSFFLNIKPHCENKQRTLYVFDLVLAMVRRWGWRFVDELCWHNQGYPGRWSERFKNRFEPVYHFAIGDVNIRHRNVVQDFSSSSGNPETFTVYDGKDNRPANTGSPFKQGSKRSAEFNGALPGNVLNFPNTAVAKDTGAYQAAAFPVKLPEFFIMAFSDENDIWLDPFLGSGTVLAACHNKKRRGFGIEKLPKYCAVILQRLQDTGLSPKREA